MEYNVAMPESEIQGSPSPISPIPTEVPVVPTTPVAKKFPLATIFISLILVLCLAIAGYFYWQNTRLKSQLTTQPTPTPVASTDPTANWKSYVHPTYKYEFKYPPTWSVVVSKNASANVFFGLTANPMTGVGGVEIREMGGDPQKYHNLNGEDIENQQLITLPSGISGYKSQIVSSPKGNDFVFKNTDGLIYHIFISSAEPQDLEIFDQILSTFKFTTPTSSDPNIKTFTSQKLGISFQYQEKYQGSNETISAKEVGNKVYVYSSVLKPDQGQYVEVFDKAPGDSLVEAISKTIMTGYAQSDCPIKTGSSNYSGSGYVLPPSYTTATIGLPQAATDDMEHIQPYLDKCPKQYISFGGLAYFLADQNHPDKFIFFSIGQYALNAGDNITWEDTFKFTD